MTDTKKLSGLALALALMGTTSAYALERAHLRVAQAEPDDEGREKPPQAQEKQRPEKSGGDEPRRSRDGGDGGDRPARPAGGKQEEGAPPARPSARDKGDDGEAPARQQRRERGDDDAPPAKKKDAAPKDATPKSADDDGAPPRTQQRPAEPEGAPPAAKTEPVEPKEPRQPQKKQQPKPAEPGADGDRKPQSPPKDGPTKDDGEPPAAKPDVKPKAPPPAPDGAAPTPKPDDKGGAAAPAPAKKGDGKEDGKDAAAPAPAPAQPGDATPSQAKDLKDLKEDRKERSEDGGKRVIIEEPDKRVIVKEGGKSIIRHDETERFRRLGGSNVRREKRDGLDISISIRPGGIEIFTESDERGRPLRRYRRDRSGREVILFDNRDYYRRHRDGSFVDAIIDLPPPRLSIPRERYIVDYEEASDVEVYEALSAPPVEELDRSYSLEEVRRSPTIRDRMRRIDLDAINFAFGSWDVASDQYPALQRVADAMKRVIERNPEEMFLIEGHTDAVGSDEDNLSLSDRRAESVSIILTEEFGVPPENMTTQGYGEQYLKVATQEAERQNRRVAIRRITPLISRGN